MYFALAAPAQANSIEGQEPKYWPVLPPDDSFNCLFLYSLFHFVTFLTFVSGTFHMTGTSTDFSSWMLAICNHPKDPHFLESSFICHYL